MDDLYQENILDHAKNPRNKNGASQHLYCAKGDNPNCGDSAVLCLKFENDLVTEVSWDGVGCAISQASMSMLSEYIKNKSLSELKKIMPGGIYSLLGVQISPARVNCALLSYRALEQVLLKYDYLINSKNKVNSNVKN